MAIAPLETVNPSAYSTGASALFSPFSRDLMREGAGFSAGLEKQLARASRPTSPLDSMSFGGLRALGNLPIRQFEAQAKFRNDLLNLLGVRNGKLEGGLFGDLLKRDTGTDSMSLLDKYGEGQRARIAQDALVNQRSALADAQRRGLGSSSFLATIPAAFQKEKNLSLGELEDKIIGQKVGVKERGADRAINIATVLAQLLGGLA